MIKNNKGCFIVAFTYNLGKCSITRAKLTGDVSYLQLDWGMGYRQVHLQLESRCEVQVVETSPSYLNHCSGPTTNPT
ncbi:hypothetical protein LINPERPRIM_LOCUS2627 [Linum perenne]